MSQSISRRRLLTGATAVVLATAATDVIAAGGAMAGSKNYKPTWESVNRHTAAPEWFRDAKFGIYFHWGAFSVPAYDSEWYPRNMYLAGHKANKHHIETYGAPADWQYHRFIDGADDLAGRHKEFAPKLKSAGGNFDPEEWAQLFVDAGARFAGPVAEHHDGYSMWDSRVNEWNSVDKGPKLDLLELFTDAVRAKDLKLLVAMHHAYNYTGFFEYAPEQSDPSLKKLYGQLSPEAEHQLWYDKLKEVIDRSRPDILWQDWRLDHVDEKQRLNFLSYYFDQANKWGKEVVATYKDGFDPHSAVFDYERGGPADITAPYWLTDDSISNSSWCYTEGIGYYSLAQMLHSFVDRISKNGTVLLNIAPKADGTIPQGQKDILLGMGDYLKRFGESVYGTRAWTVYGEGPTKMGGGSFTRPTAGTARDIRFTRDKEGTVLYATVLGWPGDSLTLKTLGSDRIDLDSLTSVELLGSEPGTYLGLGTPEQKEAGLKVALPAKPFDAPAYVLRFRFSGAIPVLRPHLGALAFEDARFRGDGVVLSLGDHTADRLTLAGIEPRGLSSLKLAPGHRLVGYSADDFTGTAWTFTADSLRIREKITSLRVVLDPAARFRITNVVNGLTLDSEGAVPSGSPLKQSAWDDSPNLQWYAVPLGDGHYKLENRANGMVADGWGATTDGSAVRQAAWKNSSDQQWLITHRGDGRYTLANRTTGLVLDGGGSVSAGSAAKQWTWGSSTNLLWTLTQV
ncbi:putative alpha-L-fucosidase [Streptomyces scabiei 87.22]|uniref:alpha-L-fucosidase n=1 Tax=Streptomyces scabiei (strain 87.22) TaxID=680198 RepID=C9Z1W6_STRSW|nr:alpha-L-fucosidase [Streptomyces scabiei]MDX2578667.1 alpha-L-fucosidase [Streptomyces scabiei]MDX2655130.1 alpha-L-fucosidase [Streptomyces scabiei]MDX2720507.1 alpha-L-fucosidase [Streptomyces scabiei]MDX2868634.1 alpha-L-fucosidase [Streptomyces scabiei]MDX2885734.1 alpha-L-fucosidase [Streptomyces scabiei]